MKIFSTYITAFYSNNCVHVETISTLKSLIKNGLFSPTDITDFGSYTHNQSKYLKVYFSTGKVAQSSNNIIIHCYFNC